MSPDNCSIRAANFPCNGITYWVRIRDEAANPIGAG